MNFVGLNVYMMAYNMKSHMKEVLNLGNLGDIHQIALTRRQLRTIATEPVQLPRNDEIQQCDWLALQSTTHATCDRLSIGLNSRYSCSFGQIVTLVAPRPEK